ncbi:metallophosphoesterase family protein [Shimia sp. R9_3]|uniref:metallophosphoesterase family protein n=1 Tax=Shimia sp. R9_3 TaxID=2821113 RepID=UPI001ADBC858|nr:metallophosphoesterase family protein [Shimia sp. R9_3]MBO9399421.1 serine/threonine protein phosphatase [Shimia sp. R9_3]
MTDPVYAIGDIHGYLEKLEDILSRIEADGGPDARIVFLGDLVDRGPNSCGVVDRLMHARTEGRPWTVVKGNHDRMFEYFMATQPKHDPRLRPELTWLHPRLGGAETLASYGVDAHADRAVEDIHADALALVPKEHIEFISSLPLFHLMNPILFVHAGIRPGIALEDQSEDDLCWIRDDFLSDPRPHPWLVVHGHTVVETVEHKGNRIDLDTGAGYGKPISVAVFEGSDVWTLESSGRKVLKPA